MRVKSDTHPLSTLSPVEIVFCDKIIVFVHTRTSGCLLHAAAAHYKKVFFIEKDLFYNLSTPKVYRFSTIINNFQTPRTFDLAGADPPDQK